MIIIMSCLHPTTMKNEHHHHKTIITIFKSCMQPTAVIRQNLFIAFQLATFIIITLLLINNFLT